EPDLAAQNRALEAELDLVARLGLQVRVAVRTRRDPVDGLVADHGAAGAVGPVRGEGRGRVPGPAPRGAELHLVDPGDVEEVLLGDDPREGRLGVDDDRELLAEGRVVIEAYGHRTEDAVLPAELLLEVEAERGLL